MAHSTTVDPPPQANPATAGSRDPSLARQLLSRVRTPRRPIFIAELGIVFLVYGVYSLIRNAVPDNEVRALARSFDVWHFEQSVNIDFELWLNHTVNAASWLAVPMNYFYALLHFIVTGIVLVWLFLQHPGRYRAARTVLMFTTFLALFGYYFYPLAPPRLLPGGMFHDTVKLYDTWGSMASGDLQSLSNQYAAMPSMHAGWSLWCGVLIFMFAQRRWLKTVGVLYPILTLLVITATANHYWLDAVGGYAALGLGFVLQRYLHGRPLYAFKQHVPAVT